MLLFLEEKMKQRIWIGGITIITIIGCIFIYLQYTLLDKNKDLIQEEGYFLSKKTSISKEELENSKSFFLYEQSTYREERQLYHDSFSEDSSYLELIHGVTPVEKTDFSIPYKIISLEGFNNLSINKVCNGRLSMNFYSENQDQLLGEHQMGQVIYDLEKEEVLFTILPDDCNYSVICDALSENYIYWLEAIPYSGISLDTWTLKGMDFQTRNSFTICKVGDFENISEPNITCYQDALYFYLNTEEEITKEYPDLEIQSITDMAYGYDLICYNPEEKLLSKKTEFNFGYNPYAYPCITEDYIYTVDYDGTNWYILSYHIPTDTYIRYQILLDLGYKSEYIQGLRASSDYVVYHTNFSRYFLLDLHTLEVREISKNLFSWYGIIKDKLFFLDGGFIYCYNISENRCYKLLEEDGFHNLICQDNICGISNGDGKIYLFYP